MWLKIVITCLYFGLGCLISASSYAQTDCPKYQKAMEAGKALMRYDSPDYDKALIEFQAAQVAARECNLSDRYIREATNQLTQVFAGIKAQLEIARREKAIADSLNVVAERLKAYFYFYDNKFALAFKDYQFYFIDKNGNKVAKLKEWDKATQFEENGFAIVQRFNEVCLLDTMGRVYVLANKVEDLKANVTALNLNKQELTKVPEAIFQHTQLKVLLLNDNKLTALPAEIGALQNLERLELNSNQITTLPKELGQLQALERLDCSSNKLAALPAEVAALPRLTYLYCYFNALKTLPADIGKASSLSFLDCSYNQITALPASFGSLQNLQMLNCNNNQLTALPTEMDKLTRLRKIHCAENLFSETEKARLQKAFAHIWIEL